MVSINRLGLLLWKNFKLKIRHPWILFFEIFIPCLFSIILLIVRLLVSFDQIDQPIIYEPTILDDNFDANQNTKTILYAPNNSDVNEIISIFQQITYFDGKVFVFFSRFF